MAKEGQFWFAQFADMNVTVLQPWVASYSVAATPTSWGTNQSQTYSVTITNAGSQAWPHTGSGLVDLGVHFTSAGGGFGNSAYYSDQRISLPADLAAGASVTLSITVTAPPNSGILVLEYQMAKETLFPYATLFRSNVTVLQPWVASYSVAATPTS